MASKIASVVDASSIADSSSITRSSSGINRGPVPAHLRPLEKKLLSLGGDRVVIDIDSCAAAICDRGVLMQGGIRPIDGAEQGSCHVTSAILQLLAPADRQIMTGYALSSNCWVRHSWILQNGKVMETTVKRDLYFGYTLIDPLEVLRFVWPEIPQPLYFRLYGDVVAGRLGGKQFKKSDLRRVQRLICTGHRGQP